MACNLNRIKQLPIDDKYKQAMLEFFSKPANRAACEALAEETDEAIVKQITDTENQLADWAKNGVPDGIRKAASNNDPAVEEEMMKTLNSHETQQLANSQRGGAQEGVASIPLPPKPASAGIPPGQLADVPMPMDRPPQAYADGGFVNAPRYGLGGFLKRLTKKIGKNLGPIGAIIGAVLAGPAGMSLAWGASLGAAAGTLGEGGSLEEAIGAGAKAYAIGGLGTAAYKGVQAMNTMGTAGLEAQVSEARASDIAGEAVSDATTAAVPDAATAAATVGETGLSTMQQAGRALGTASYIGGLVEGQEEEESTPYVDVVQDYYDCVAANGSENCTIPEEMKGPAPRQFGQSSNMQDGKFVTQLPPTPANYEYGGAVNAIGTETSDSQPAWLSDNEFVMTADAVRGAGAGNVDQGAQEMHRLMKQLEQRGRS